MRHAWRCSADAETLMGAEARIEILRGLARLDDLAVSGLGLSDRDDAVSACFEVRPGSTRRRGADRR
ncbi:MAG: hypothetical protein R3F18_02315 [Lysobacterales bacterium]